jgi:superfamily I DNA/RNA helicase
MPPVLVVQAAQGTVTITTIHAAKGLEWPVVFTPTLNDYYLPVYFWPTNVDDSGVARCMMQSAT